jgi:hypothetical protein
MTATSRGASADGFLAPKADPANVATAGITIPPIAATRIAHDERSDLTRRPAHTLSVP